MPQLKVPVRLLVLGAVPQGLASEGFGSLTLVRVREIVGRTLSSTLSFSLICGVTVMMKPTGTEFTVVSNVVIEGLLAAAAVFAVTVK